MIFRILTASLLLSFLSDVRADVITFEELTTFTGANPAGGGSFYNGNSGYINLKFQVMQREELLCCI